MTDEQILKRLAEIESRLCGEEGIDKDWFISGGALHRNVDIGPIRQTHWSPLRQAADWGPLIEKYRLCIINCEEDDTWTVFAGENCQTDYYESLPHAICLAIIEANGGMGDEQ